MHHVLVATPRVALIGEATRRSAQRYVWGGLLIGLTVVSLGSLFVTACSTSEATYVRQDQAMLTALPLMPGTTLTTTTSTTHTKKNCEEPITCRGGAYVTNARFSEEPPALPNQVVRFYLRQLASAWAMNVRPAKFGSQTEYWVASERGHAAIGLMTGRRAPGGDGCIFALSMDHDGG